MAWNNCNSLSNNIFGCNVCELPIGGYTGRALLIPFEFADIKINSVSVFGYNGDGTMSFRYVDVGSEYIDLIYSIIPILDKSTNPFFGTNVVGNTEYGRNMFKKTVQFTIPVVMLRNNLTFMRSFTHNNNGAGFFIILERKTRMSMSSINDALWRYEVIGRQCPLRYDGDSFSRNEYENSGMIKFTMSTVENIQDVFCLSSSMSNGNIETFDKYWNNITCVTV